MLLKNLHRFALILALGWACSGPTAKEGMSTSSFDQITDNPDDKPRGDYPYFIRAKVNGELKEYRDPDLLQFSKATIMPGVHQAAVVGGALDTEQNGSSGGFTIFIKDDEQIKAKRYDFLEPFEETGFGLKGATIGYYTAGHRKNYVSDVNKEAPVVVISELTDDYARGTFQGKIYDIVGGEMVSLTDGEFYVERLN
ncbi:hypothetical protein [Algoriphagus namhaensis]